MQGRKNLLFAMLMLSALVLGHQKLRVMALTLVSAASCFSEVPFWSLWMPLVYSVGREEIPLEY